MEDIYIFVQAEVLHVGYLHNSRMRFDHGLKF